VLKGRKILIGITGSVAAYKAIELIKELKKEGATVKALMTESSKRFVTPLSIEIATENEVFCDMFQLPFSHIDLVKEVDLFIVAPATANIIGKYANGIADDLLSTSLLVFNGRPIFVPAMNWRMYENPVVQKNIQHLSAMGVKFVGPERGKLACGEEGIGRMAKIESIVESIKTAFTKQDLSGECVLVTAGPTREYIDPIRYISNRSSGKMGYAIAKVAKRRGAEVTLISGPVSLPYPEGIEVIRVESAEQMREAVLDNVSISTIFIMAAAVSDFAPAETKSTKIEKKESLSIELLKTPDILEEAAKFKNRPFIVGFSAETGNRIDRARKKLKSKNVDMIVFNDVSKSSSGFDVDTNEVVLIDRESEIKLPLMTKEEIAYILLDRIIELKCRG
jgi:phosphopantothenoylcysteine decarboxylase/phosphopantothenate--cysteine ligase